MYMTYDIVGSYCIRHRMYHTWRMLSYVNKHYRMPDIRCRTCFGGAVPAVSKEPDPLPTAKVNGVCLSYSKVFIFSLATSKTVSETRLFSHPKKGLWLRLIGIASGPANCADRLWVCQRASQYQSWSRMTVFRCYPRGWRRGNDGTYPLKPASPRTDFA